MSRSFYGGGSGGAAAAPSVPPQSWPWPVVSGDVLLGTYVTGTANTALTSGTLTLLPVDLSAIQPFDALSLSIGTAQVGGTSTCWLAVYADDGTGSRPTLAGGPLASVTATTTAAGQQFGVLGSAWTPPAAGRYWLAALWVASVAPTTTPAAQFVSTVGRSLPTSSAGTVSRGWSATGLTALPTTAITLSRISTNLAVSVGLRAA
jgi:hypothetical protein